MKVTHNKIVQNTYNSNMQIRYRYYNALCNTCKSTWSTSCL